MPSNWRPRKLGELADITIGRTPPRGDARYWAPDLERPFCTIADMRGRSIFPLREGVSELAEIDGKAKRVPEGALMMSFKLTIGRVGFAGVDLFPNEAIAWLQILDAGEVDERFLALVLEDADYSALTGRAVKGATLNGSSLPAVPVLLPPLVEQKRIAGLVGRADDVVDGATACLDAAERLFQAMLADVIDGSDAERCPVASVVTAIIGGESPRCLGRPPEPGEWGVLKVSAVKATGFRHEESKALPEGLTPNDKALVRKGDVLITRSNTAERVGLACHVDETPGSLLLSDLIWRLEPAVSVEPRYLAYALVAPAARQALTAVATGTSGSMKKINHEKLRRLEIPLPEKAAQAEAADRLDAAKLTVTALTRYRESAQQVRQALVTSLLSAEQQIDAEYDRFLPSLAVAT